MGCVFIAVGILSVLAVVTLRQEPAGADDDTLAAIGQSLVAVKDWTFRSGPALSSASATG